LGIKYGTQELRNRRNEGKESFFQQRRGGAEERIVSEKDIGSIMLISIFFLTS
jgi:hypothetical protein